MDEILRWINPLHYWGMSEYTGFWARLFDTVLRGFWGRFFAASCILLAFYFGVRRQRIAAGLWFVCMAAFLIYGGAVLGWLGLLDR